MDKEFPALDVSNKVIAWASLLIIPILEIIVFVKLHFKLDLSVIFLMLTFLVIIIQRVIVDFFNYPPLSVTILQPIASNISYALLYYFVFEMMYIVSTIKSMTHTEQRERNKNISRIKIIVFTVQFVIYIPSTLIGHIFYKSY